LSGFAEREAAHDQIGLGNRFYSEANAGADHIQPCFKLIPQPLARGGEMSWIVGWNLDDILIESERMEHVFALRTQFDDTGAYVGHG
jgi:hypothetical protein